MAAGLYFGQASFGQDMPASRAGSKRWRSILVILDDGLRGRLKGPAGMRCAGLSFGRDATGLLVGSLFSNSLSLMFFAAISGSVIGGSASRGSEGWSFSGRVSSCKRINNQEDTTRS